MMTRRERDAAVARRISFVEKVQERAGAGELLSLDLSPDSPDLARLRLGESGATAEEQKLVLATLKSYQRVFMLTNAVAEAKRLIENGYSSAVAIGTRSLDEFRSSWTPRSIRTGASRG